MSVSRGNSVSKIDLESLLSDCKELQLKAFGADASNISNTLTELDRETRAASTAINKALEALKYTYQAFSSLQAGEYPAPSPSTIGTLILASDYDGLNGTVLDYLGYCFSYVPCTCQSTLCDCDGTDSSCYLRCYGDTPSTCSNLQTCTDFDANHQNNPECDIYWCGAFYWQDSESHGATCHTAFLTDNCNPYGYYCPMKSTCSSQCPIWRCTCESVIYVAPSC